ncbi:MAG: ATP-binding cassette domain-containing protein [Bradyrhizobium sp.]|nr:ATP-binding cassette domain-containing protein [Bradyrhizobium sp.]
MRGAKISFISNSGGKPVGEPRVPTSVKFASFAINLLALALPLSIMQVYDRIIPNRALATLVYLFLTLILAILIDYVLKTSRSALLSWHATQFVEKIEHAAVSRFLRAPNGAFERVPPAVNLNRYAAAAALADYHCGQSRLIAIDLPFAVIALVVMAIVGGPMVLVPAILFFFFAALAIGRAREFRKILDARTAQDHRKYDFIAEILAGIHTVKVMAMEPQMQRRFERLQQAVAESTMASILTGQANQTSAQLYGSISQLIVVAIGGSLVVNDRLTMGALACCTMLSGQILQPLLRAISLWTEKESVDHRRTEVRLLLDLPTVEPAPADRAETGSDIQFAKVRFSYDAASDFALTVDLSIAAGTIVGVKGKDGSGRTTLLKLIQGDIEPTSGRVSIGPISTGDPKFQSIRPCIVYVGATPVIFSGTIMDNLTIFSPEKRDFARKMSELMGLEAIINLLPDGYETMLGGGIGDDLPTSIAQQVNIVRALTTRPRILALDEANMVLDAIAEPALIRALDRLRGYLTTIVVTHRPSLLALCDHQITIQDGHATWSRSAPDSQRVAL